MKCGSHRYFMVVIATWLSEFSQYIQLFAFETLNPKLLITNIPVDFSQILFHFRERAVLKGENIYFFSHLLSIWNFLLVSYISFIIGKSVWRTGRIGMTVQWATLTTKSRAGIFKPLQLETLAVFRGNETFPTTKLKIHHFPVTIQNASNRAILL